MLQLFGLDSYLTLFVVSFLAASVIPLGSEWLVSAQLLHGMAPWPVVGVATLGNSMGAGTTYLIGRYGGPWVIRRIWRIDPQAQNKAELFFQRYGAWSLLLSWLPIIGDPLCLAAGVFKIPVSRFALLVVLGKFGRYAFMAGLLQGILRLLAPA